MKDTKPVKKRIKLLVEALRSGEYKQARDALRVGNRYCCLGVACDVYRKETGSGEWIRSKYGPRFMSFLDEVAGMPSAVAGWYGLTGNPVLVSLNTSAVNANDTGRTFTEIADAFEKDYLKSKRKSRA